MKFNTCLDGRSNVGRPFRCVELSALLCAVVDDFFRRHVEAIASHHAIGMGIDYGEAPVIVDAITTPPSLFGIQAYAASGAAARQRACCERAQEPR